MKTLSIVAGFLFALCLPVFLISSNLRVMIGQIDLYEYEFQRYGIAEVTGFQPEELTKAARGLIDYLISEEDSARIRVVKDGREIDLFNDRELAHLVDVKGIIGLFHVAQIVTLAYALAYAATGLATRGRLFLRSLMRALLFGCSLTLALFAFVGAWAAIDFDGLFLTFHLASFQNDLWILDPTRDHLIMMFPEGFFFDAALLLVLATVAEALILGGGALAYLRRRHFG